MRALRLTHWQQPVEFQDVEVPDPGPGQVLVEVAASGACHSDLHLMEWPAGAVGFDVPFTLGHETTGTVTKVGAGVATDFTGWSEGDPVAVYGPWGCGRCRPCRQGFENYCEHTKELGGSGIGLGRDGGMAEYVLVDAARHLVALGDLDPVAAAPLTDAGLTPYHAVKRSLPKLVPGSTAVVIGAGGLGHLAVQILRAVSPARVVAVDAREDALEVARQAGAHETLLAGDEAGIRVKQLTGGLGAELVLDFVGADQSLASARGAARVGGDLTVVGLAGGRLEWSFMGMPYDCNLATTYWGGVGELMELFDLARDGLVRAEYETFPLDRATEAYERLREGQVRGRAVVVPS